MIYVTGDIHGELGVTRLNSVNFPQGQSLSKDDFVLILGDFGLVWDNKQGELELNWLKWLTARPWTTLFIDGNHENFDRLLGYPIMDFHGGKASRIHDTVYYLRRGEVFTFNGKTCFVMGGAMSSDKEYRVPGKSWWSQEEPNSREWRNASKNLAAHNNQVDYVLTHTAPQSILKKLATNSPCIIDTSRTEDPVAIALEKVRKKVTFKRWYFGHLHCNWKYEEYSCLYQKMEELK